MQQPHISPADSSRLMRLLEENLQGQTALLSQVEMLRESEFKYRSILEELDLGYMEVDLEGRVMGIHPRFSAMTGFSASELVGTRGEAMLDEEGLVRMQEVVELRKKGQASSYELPILHKAGHRLWFLITGAPIRNIEGEVVGSVGIHFDVTTRKLLELETNRALAAEAYARNRERGLLMKMSHEIRTPINAINGMFNLMDTVPRSAEYEAIWQGAIRATQMLRRVVDDVLDLSRLELGQPSLNSQKVDVIEVTSGVAKMHHLLAEEKGIELDCNCELDVTRRELDVDKWLQILTNLLGNAIKFTEQGEVSLRIRNHEEFDDWLVAVVQDDGPGIPVENLDRIFEPFGLMKDDDASVKNRHHVPSGSTGLGLSIARELAELMGGDLKVVPSEKGAVFELAIPAPVWHEDDGERRSSHDGSGTNDVSVPGWDGPSMDILLAEDNDINVLYARALLERWGMKVSLAKDGLEALDLWEKGTFDLVLLDVQMPTMDGLETLRRMRAIEAGQQKEGCQAVYMVTAFADKETKSMAAEHGADGFLAKPFSPREMLEVMRIVSRA